MIPYYSDSLVTLYHGDCLDILPTLEANSFSRCITDPPYALGFMGRDWDSFGDTGRGARVRQERVKELTPNGEGHSTSKGPYLAVGIDSLRSAGLPFQRWCFSWASALLRILCPGAHLLAFGGTRTFHRLTCALEDAGWEIRDCLMWLHGQGFPKSLDMSKQLDRRERERWLDVSKAINNLNEVAILKAWKEHSKRVNNAGLSFRKNETATGMNISRNGFVPASVLLQVNPKRSNANAIIAELLLSGAHRTDAAISFSVPVAVEGGITELSVLAIIAESSHENPDPTPSTADSFVPQSAWDCLAGSMEETTKAAEALLTWLGSKPCSRKESTDVLCAELTKTLKRIIVSQSESFLTLDTKSQTAFVSATTATITESTAASLISFTAAILKRKALDKIAGAEREVVGISATMNQKTTPSENAMRPRTMHPEFGNHVPITAPATDTARLWSGYGTALKPAWEPIILARKPLDGTVAQNVLKWGCGALNIDGCRISTPDDLGRPQGTMPQPMDWGNKSDPNSTFQTYGHAAGRFPANLLLDEDAAESLDEQSGTLSSNSGEPFTRNTDKTRHSYGHFVGNREVSGFYGDSGGASRFFYVSKASRAERGKGNTHPTVKPTDLIEYLFRFTSMPVPAPVIDPFAGSGTMGVVAKRLGVPCVLIEKDESYCEIAAKRCEMEACQPELF